ncbi:NEL-type E3 ubiquitin ligase domain-containing protein [Pseudomonas sp. NPDC087803]|uniref:NEL-type E3 ubiquitin ligase domain-containing protein n=1 Tax=Pseudomonas sp. NPDC087803 TaxID=3364448 RepID=UPI003802A39A
MSTHPPRLPTATNTPRTAPGAGASLHGQLIEQTIPGWLASASSARRAAIKGTGTQLPDWHQRLSVEQQQALRDRVTGSFLAQSSLDRTMSALEDVEAFAEKLLTKALKDRFDIALDLRKTLLCLRRPLEVSVLEIEVSTFEVLKLPLLQAALHNFEEAECEADAFHRKSGFVIETATPGTFQAASVGITVPEFLSLCRSLNVGARYQERIKQFFQSTDGLRQQFITAQKTALRAAAELALLKKDIEPDDYSMILSVVDGEIFPRLGNKSVWFRDLSLMQRRMTGCVVFSISERYRYTNEFIVYIPHDPEHPLKRYTSAQMREMFRRKFTATDAAAPDGEPTAYQRFFSQFVAYAERPYYYGQFTQVAADAPSDPLHSIWVKVAQLLPPISSITRIKELPPERQGKREPQSNPFLDPFGVTREGVSGLWADNTDLWQYLYEQHSAKLIADARAHAVPTADVDAKARAEKLNHLLEFGLLALNLVSMFVPVLGEIMMTVMAGQLLYESFEGAIEWSEGDQQAAKAHLVDVAENLALIGVMAGVGKGLGKLGGVAPEPVIEKLHPVERADGTSRLWRPDLSAYECDVMLSAAAGPDAQGLYRLDEKLYIRQQGKVYQTFYDDSLKTWRIRHPHDATAYQPILEHNRLGAWRHSLERPQSWDRLTLLRRIGHSTEAFTDQQLLDIADLSGVSDEALCQMHLEHQPVPLPLADTLRLYEVDQRVGRIIEQVEQGTALDDQYELTLPLLSEMPRWPRGTVIEVFDGPQLSGAVSSYGVESILPHEQPAAAIRLTRAELLDGKLPERILESLDEAQITGLLGAEPARVVETRPLELRKQMADFLKTRQAAMFERLYTEPPMHDRRIVSLQAATPGLGSSAATRVLLEADAEELARLESGKRLPLRLLEASREYARQRRFDHAVAGLHMENLGSAESKWLALRALERLPGWSEQLRLQVREGSIHGPLIDSIGSESAGQSKYLIKHGAVYQACNELGEALNGMPRQGDNFFASILHALPDQSRQALGFADVTQSASLRRALIEHVALNRGELARLASKRWGAKKLFKAPERVRGHGLGYYASGRGQGVNPLLVTRVQDVYPALTDQQAGGFILKHLADGKTDAQIYDLLQRRMREWQELESTLAHWEGVPTPEPSLQAMIGGKPIVIRNLKQSWRNSPLAETQARFGRLDLTCDEPLPALTADFSHVRDLHIRGRCITDANADSLLSSFPGLQSLRINATGEGFSKVPSALQGMQDLTDLTLYTTMPFASDVPLRLSELTRLEALSVSSSSYQPIAFDVSRLRHLRKLEIIAYSLFDWPAGALDLPNLERLNLRGTAINTVPDGLLQGHETLWSGLSLDWSRFSRENFKGAYEYVKSHPEHLIDREAMVRDYCQGELRRLGEGVSESPEGVFNRFFEQWPDEQQRYRAISALSEQYAALDGELGRWQQSLPITPQSLPEIIGRSNLAHALRMNWRKGMFKRYGATITASTLDLSGLKLSELPLLPADAFPHVRTLLLQDQRVAAGQLRRFVSAFNGVQNLDLSENALSEWPIEPGRLARLSRLNLADNLLTDTTSLQTGLRALPSLEQLNLQNNPLTTLNVSSLQRLKALNLQGTHLQNWPLGAENLPQLTWLDLRDTRITTLSGALLESTSLLTTNLTGAPLTAETSAALRAAQQQLESTIGLPDGALEAFAAEPVPAVFPPAEDGLSISRHLLPLPQAPAGEGLALMRRNLQRMQPAFTDEQALVVIEQLRTSGETDAQLSQRISAWNQTFETLVRQLNGWLYTREIRGPDWTISSQSRSLAAWRILTCWRARLHMPSATADAVLDLNGLQLGDFPALPQDFAHVGNLNLTGCRMTAEGSNDFLKAFTHLRSLALSGNELAALPQAVRQMSALERLELSSNNFSDTDHLYDVLAGHAQLHELNLSYNHLDAFDVSYFEQLQSLDLRNNNLAEWPAGALDAQHLQSLNLSRNDITTIPEQALDGRYDRLMEGTDLTDNYNLSEETLERLRTYQASGERLRVLGFSRSDLEEMADDIAGGLSETTSSIESDEILPGEQANARQKAPWLANLAPQQLASRDTLWDQLAAEPDSEAFFHLLDRLQDTQEFRVANADLTRRVWVVMEAAAASSELREVIFAGSATHGTCVDGRILTFSGLESKVFTYNALLDLPAGRPGIRGQALLALSRQLFRLDTVDELARSAAASSGFDEAEVRLGYRIGLTGGWDDGLELPGQPKNMTFASGVTPQQLVNARAEVLSAERSERFLEDLIQRDYWLDYLRERQPEAFSKLDEAQWQEEGEDEELSADDPLYLSRLFDQAAARNARLIELSRQEIEQIAETAGSAPRPGSSRSLSGA